MYIYQAHEQVHRHAFGKEIYNVYMYACVYKIFLVVFQLILIIRLML